MLGTTGLTATPFGLGLAAVGRPAYITAGRDADFGTDRGQAALERRTHDLLDVALAEGLGYIDTARSYGLAERFLGSWLASRQIAPGALTVASKWGYTYIGQWRTDAEVHEVKDHSLGALRRQLAETREILGDHLSLYQIHSATLETGVLEDKAVLAELAGLRAGGLAVGLTVSGERQAEVVRLALEAEIDGVNPFGSVQATWNLLEQAAGPALAEAHAAGWGVIVKEAVANGRLTPHGPDHREPVLARVAADHQATVDQIALAAVVAQPWVDVVLSGAATAGELRSNVGAFDVRLADHELEELLQLAERPAAYWATRSSLPWS
jgi:aryl-alcohol dehydrogenase-like predicted oxidoreductase